MFTMAVYVLGGAVLDGKTPMSEESFNYPTPTERKGGGAFPNIGTLFVMEEIIFEEK